jgi:putative hemin transport protein
MSTLTEHNPLAEAWGQLRAEQPAIRIRNAAEALGVSEYELLATGIGQEVTPLRQDFDAILEALGSLGDVMGLTRNESVVHERKGVYDNFSAPSPAVALFVNEEIDLRVFKSVWAFAVAVEQKGAKGKVRKSIQFFSKWGEAVHKVFLTPKSDELAFSKLVENFRIENAPATADASTKPSREERIELSEALKSEFLEEWRNLKDTHDYFGVLKKYNLPRQQALEVAEKAQTKEGKALTVPCTKEVIPQLLEQLAAAKTPLMVFVGNAGMIQIHTGEVTNLMWHGQWYNVMDKRFQMHLNMDDVARVWLVRKPTTDGDVTSLEVFDANEELIVQFFGKRKPGIPEDSQWRTTVESVCNA